MYKEELDVMEKEMRKIGKCDMEKFSTLDSIYLVACKMIAILG